MTTKECKCRLASRYTYYCDADCPNLPEFIKGLPLGMRHCIVKDHNWSGQNYESEDRAREAYYREFY